MSLGNALEDDARESGRRKRGFFPSELEGVASALSLIAYSPVDGSVGGASCDMDSTGR